MSDGCVGAVRLAGVFFSAVYLQQHEGDVRVCVCCLVCPGLLAIFPLQRLTLDVHMVRQRSA
jgi:hypothetical protein